MEYQVTVDMVNETIFPGGRPVSVTVQGVDRYELAKARALLGIMERLEHIAELLEQNQRPAE